MELRADFKPSILVCTPMRFIPSENGRGERMEPITMEWHRAMKTLLMPMGYNVGEIRADGFEIGVARNKVVEEARRRCAKYLMFIDADTMLPQNGLQILTYQLDNNPEFDVAAGFYTQKGFPAVPLIWHGWGEGVYWDWTLGDVLKDGIVGCATGCMLIRLSVFDRLDYSEDMPWFKTDERVMSGEGDLQFVSQMTDDLWFCKRVVEDAKSKILIDTNVYCKHIDWRTGKIYQLADDALPVRRLAARLDSISDSWMNHQGDGNGSDVLKRIVQDVISRAPERSKVIVEVGSFVGNSTKVIAEALSGKGKLYCVDTWEGSANDKSGTLTDWIGGKQSLFEQFKKNTAPYLNDETVVPMMERSISAAQKLNAKDVKADMVFIDANHDEAAADIAAWLPLVRPGGIICGHDYSEKFPHVMRDVQQVFGSNVESDASIWIHRLPEKTTEVAA